MYCRPRRSAGLDFGVSDVDHDRSTFGRRPCARSRANATSALAKSRMARAADSPYAAGRTAVALAGQWTTTSCGVSAGSTSSITRRSFSVRSPSARRVVLGDDWLTVPPSGIEALGSAYYANQGRYL